MAIMFIPIAFSFIFGIIGIIASYILHKKTKKKSTLLILIASIMTLISTFFSVIGYSLGTLGTYNQYWQHIPFWVMLALSYLPPAFSAVGLWLYAVKLPALISNPNKLLHRKKHSLALAFFR